MKIPTANPGISPVKVCIFKKTQLMNHISRRKFSALAGSLAGGMIMLKVGIYRSLWLFGILQALSTAGFALLAQIGHSVPALAAVIDA